MRKTCPKSEYLMIDEGIYSLAHDILDPSEIDEAEEISLDITSSKSKRDYAITRLQAMTGVKPKRPLYYCHHELEHLPHWTRDAVRYIGDYIDQLIKYLASEVLDNPENQTKSLGVNLGKLGKKLPEQLHHNLVRYNKLIYVPAKHEFSVKHRRHLFTSKEVVFIYFISLKLKNDILKLSKDAKKYSEEKLGYISKGGYI